MAIVSISQAGAMDVFPSSQFGARYQCDMPDGTMWHVEQHSTTFEIWSSSDGGETWTSRLTVSGQVTQGTGFTMYAASNDRLYIGFGNNSNSTAIIIRFNWNGSTLTQGATQTVNSGGGYNFGINGMYVMPHPDQGTYSGWDLVCVWSLNSGAGNATYFYHARCDSAGTTWAGGTTQVVDGGTYWYTSDIIPASSTPKGQTPKSPTAPTLYSTYWTGSQAYGLRAVWGGTTFTLTGVSMGTVSPSSNGCGANLYDDANNKLYTYIVTPTRLIRSVFDTTSFTHTTADTWPMGFTAPKAANLYVTTDKFVYLVMANDTGSAGRGYIGKWHVEDSWGIGTSSRNARRYFGFRRIPNLNSSNLWHAGKLFYSDDLWFAYGHTTTTLLRAFRISEMEKIPWSIYGSYGNGIAGSPNSTWTNGPTDGLTIAVLSVYGSTASVATTNTPAGWTKHVDEANTNSTYSRARVAVFTKPVATASDSVTFTLTGTMSRWHVDIMHIPPDPTTGVVAEVAGTVQESLASGASPRPFAAGTPTKKYAAWFGGAHHDQSATTSVGYEDLGGHPWDRGYGGAVAATTIGSLTALDGFNIGYTAGNTQPSLAMVEVWWPTSGGVDGWGMVPM